MKKGIQKTYLKTWAVKGFYQYNIFEINANGDKWLQAEPLNAGLVCRTAENETIMRIILENDCANWVKTLQKRQKAR